MGCVKCRKVLFDRDSYEEKSPIAASQNNGLHKWVPMKLRNGEEYCVRCHIKKRSKGENAPCPGVPPWEVQGSKKCP